MNIPNPNSASNRAELGVRYSRYENSPSVAQVAAELRRNRIETERRRRRSEMTERGRVASRREAVMNELRFVQGMGAQDWEMDEL